LNDVESQIGTLDFVRLARLQARLNRHGSMVLMTLLGRLYRPKAVREYRAFLKALYDRLQSESDFDALIDCSKYPSHLAHLRGVYSDNRIRVVHLVRNPIELARAMRTSNQGKPRSLASSVLYFFVVNLLSLVASNGLQRDRYLLVRYEDLVSEPERIVEMIGNTLGLDCNPAIDRISSNQPLRRGHIFNGNRMRMQEEVIFRRSTGLTHNRSWLEHVVEWLANRAFGSTMTTSSHDQSP
jgi:hypothetical protein